ncbi:MAG: hypothetical protein ACOYI8_08935 [Christensenellales bacterium]|jgi:hypothetical protein
MKERKYKNFFVAAADGTRVYTGKYYVHPKEGKAVGFALSALYAAFILLYFLENAPSVTCIYVFPIAAARLFPALYWLMGAFSRAVTGEKITIVQRESGIGRAYRAAVGCATLGLLTLGAEIVFCALNGFSYLSLAYNAIALLLSAIGAAHAKTVYAKTREEVS